MLERNIRKIEVAKLRVKVKSLAAESAIIRKEEKGHWNVYNYNPLQNHRIKNVRHEARATQLARAYLEGKTYRKIELSRKAEKESEFKYTIAPRVKEIVAKYSHKKKEFNESWFD